MRYKYKKIRLRIAAGLMACMVGTTVIPGNMTARAADASAYDGQTAEAILADVTADKAELQKQLERAEALNDSMGTYTSYTWDALAAVYAAASRVYADADAVQAQVDSQTASVQAAIDALTKLSTAELADGLYEINAEIVNAADPGRLSMADGALEADTDGAGNRVKKPLTVRVKDGQAVLGMRFVSLTNDLNGTQFTGYLGQLKYYPDHTDTDSLPGANEKLVSADVVSTYSGYDEFNDPDFGTDDIMRGTSYPREISIPVAIGDTEVWLQVYVPVMESIAAGCGTQQARLHLDWSDGSLVQIRDESIDISKLEKQIKYAKKLKQGESADDTWQALAKAIESAQTVHDSLSSTQEQIDAQVNLLQKAMAAVQIENGTADKSSLEDAINRAKKAVSKTSDYTQSSLNTLSTILTYAQGVYDNSASDQAAVDAAVKALNSAISGLVGKKGIKTSALSTEIDKAESLLKKTSTYTTDSLSTLQISVNNAKRVLAAEDKTQDDVDAAVTALKNAEKGLIKKAVVNKSTLKSKIASAQKYSKKTDTYTSSTIDNLKTAIKAAQKIYNDKTATQSSVDAQVTALDTAINSLAKKGNSTQDKSKLSDGVYAISGSMVKIDKTSASMSDAAINHTLKLTVKKGKYYITMKFSGLTVSGKQGYLSKLKYFKTGYTLDKFGSPQGSLAAVTIDSYQTDSAGKRLSDSLGTDYPYEVTFALIPEAVKDGYVPLQVFVPIMESISAGTGTQPVFLKLDWSSLKETTQNDPAFNKRNSSGGNTNNGGGSTNNGGSQTGGGSKIGGGSTVGGSSSLGGGSGLSGSSKLGSSGLSGNSKLGSTALTGKGKNSKLGGSSSSLSGTLGTTGVLNDIGTLGAGSAGGSNVGLSLAADDVDTAAAGTADTSHKSELTANTILLLLIFVGEAVMFIYMITQKKRKRRTGDER